MIHPSVLFRESDRGFHANAGLVAEAILGLLQHPPAMAVARWRIVPNEKFSARADSESHKHALACLILSLPPLSSQFFVLQSC